MYSEASVRSLVKIGRRIFFEIAALFRSSEMTFVGAFVNSALVELGSCVPVLDIFNYLKLFKMGRLSEEQLISHKIQIGDIKEGFEGLTNEDAVRQIIIFKS